MTDKAELANDTYSLEAWMVQRVRELAQSKDLTKSQIVRRALREYFERIDSSDRTTAKSTKVPA